MFDVILFSDTPEFATKTRGYGCHRLASHIREHGYSCLVVDFCSAINYNQYKDIIENAVSNTTLLIGFSTTWLPYKLPGETPQIVDPGRSYQDEGEKILDHRYKDSLTSAFTFNRTSHWFELIKSINPKTKIMLGGTKIDMYLDQPYIDHIMVGYGETMIVDLLDSLSKKSRRIFNKIIDHDQKARNNVWDFKESKTTYTEYDFVTPNETLSLEVSRGCKFKCSFCSYPLIGEKNILDYLKHEKILKDELLDNYNRWGITQYYLMDDTFNDSSEKLDMLKRVLDSLPFKINFWCYLRLDLLAVHPEQIPMLLDMGLSQCYFGIETFHPKASKSIGKGMSADKRKETLNLCKSVWGDQVHIQAGFIVGLPHEPISSIEDTGRYLKDSACPIDEAWVFPLSIAADHESTKYMYKSDIDKNYANYGYHFNDPNKFWDWSKEDDTDIPNLETADRIASENDPSEFRKLYKGDFYKASLNHPILSNRQLTMAMTDKEYSDLLLSINRWDLYMKTIQNDYIKPLIKKLKSKK
jgi:hypothetical protein